jgi:dTDP-glucose 4,6-dehydratase
VRDWIYVTDHCVAIDTILRNGKIGEIYNVGANEEFNNISVVNEILMLTGGNQSLIKFVDDRKGHDLRYAIDSSKLSALGWTPIFDFKSGLFTTVNWYKQNNEWIKSLDLDFDLAYGSLVKGSI